MGWCRTDGNEVVWDGGSEPPVVPTRWALLEVALGGAPVWPCGGGVGFTEGSVGRRPPCYLPLGQEMCEVTTETKVDREEITLLKMIIVLSKYPNQYA